MENTLIPAKKLKHVLKFTVEKVIAIEDELNSLDRAIGDGDHGANMSRGCKSLLENIDDIKFDSTADVFISIGNTLISSIGGASGALYGTLFINIGKNMNTGETVNDFIIACEKGIDAMMVLGSSHINQKTMLDVLVPVLEILKEQQTDLSEVARKARNLSNSTINMKAEKGRASYLGDRSIGHLDPGAYSSEVIVCSICEALNNHG